MRPLLIHQNLPAQFKHCSELNTLTDPLKPMLAKEARLFAQASASETVDLS